MKLKSKLTGQERAALEDVKTELEKSTARRERVAKTLASYKARGVEVEGIIADLRKQVDEGDDVDAITDLAARESQIGLLKNSILRKEEEEKEKWTDVQEKARAAISAASAVAKPRLREHAFATLLPLFSDLHAARRAFTATDLYNSIESRFYEGAATWTDPSPASIEDNANRALGLLNAILDEGELLDFAGTIGAFEERGSRE